MCGMLVRTSLTALLVGSKSSSFKQRPRLTFSYKSSDFCQGGKTRDFSIVEVIIKAQGKAGMEKMMDYANYDDALNVGECDIELQEPKIFTLLGSIKIGHSVGLRRRALEVNVV